MDGWELIVDILVPLSATLKAHLLRLFGPSEEAFTVFVHLIVAAINSMSGLSSQVVMLIKKMFNKYWI